MKQKYKKPVIDFWLKLSQCSWYKVESKKVELGKSLNSPPLRGIYERTKDNTSGYSSVWSSASKGFSWFQTLSLMKSSSSWILVKEAFIPFCHDFLNTGNCAFLHLMISWGKSQNILNIWKPVPSRSLPKVDISSSFL